MTRFILTDEQPIVLTDHSTGDVQRTTKFEARAVLEAWYGLGEDPTVRDEIDCVATAIENHSDLSGSAFLGLSIELAD